MDRPHFITMAFEDPFDFEGDQVPNGDGLLASSEEKTTFWVYHDCFNWSWGLQLSYHFVTFQVPYFDAFVGSRDKEVGVDGNGEYPTCMGVDLPDALPSVCHFAFVAYLLSHFLEGCTALDLLEAVDVLDHAV